MPKSKTQKPKRGRRFLPPEKRRSRMIPVYMTPDIADELATRRQQTGQSESQQLIAAYLYWRGIAESPTL